MNSLSNTWTRDIGRARVSAAGLAIKGAAAERLLVIQPHRPGNALQLGTDTRRRLEMNDYAAPLRSCQYCSLSAPATKYLEGLPVILEALFILGHPGSIPGKSKQSARALPCP